jgi:thiol-disulfide isomerase/thioredoxin
MLDSAFIARKFAQGLPYAQYVAHATPDQAQNWQRAFQRITLTQQHRELIGGFQRSMKVLVSSGLWCGDCAYQCPMLAHIAQAAGPLTAKSGIDLRFLNRDEHMDFADRVKICGGNRVPTAIFISEDDEFVSMLGDKTLTRLRSKAAKALGQYCPLPGEQVPDDELAQTLQEWVDAHEHAQLTLRLSTRLRTKHDD